jgi:ubiquinone/menaquinone biosynthesis C-methylase UbiE
LVVAGAPGLVSAYLIDMGCIILYVSQVGKLSRRDRLINLNPQRGAETVMDVGCGSGLMMIGTAKHLASGKSVEIDVRQAEDQRHKHPNAALKNARLEGVADRVDFQTSDMRFLGFGDDTFYMIVSHWAIHNLYDHTEREIALKELVRVLKLGGYIILADIEHKEKYAPASTEFDLQNLKLIKNGLCARFAVAVSLGSYRPATVFALK